MVKKHDAIVIDPKDNVAIAVMDLQGEQNVLVKGEGFSTYIEIVDDIVFGHKFALKDLKEGTQIIKYGEIIGRAIRCIQKGEHVHDHNIVGIRGKRKG